MALVVFELLESELVVLEGVQLALQAVDDALAAGDKSAAEAAMAEDVSPAPVVIMFVAN